MSFLSTEVVRQDCSDHNAILLGSTSHKPINDFKDTKSLFKFEAYWAKDKHAKNLVRSVWDDNKNNCNFIECLDKICSSLGPWQHARTSRSELGCLYTEEESYWAQRSRIAWLKEGDKNTRFFHVRAIERFKKNNIEGITDMDGNWVEGTTNVYRVAWNYFNNLFSSEAMNDERVISHVRRCISSEMDKILLGHFTNKEILDTFAKMDPLFFH
ncbi:hypothetical protein V6Z11_A10G104400 [Gossypium hirsutum]